MARGLVGKQVDGQVLAHGIFQQVHHIAVVGYGDGFPLLHGLACQGKGLWHRVGDVPHPTLPMACFDARSIYLGNDSGGSGHLGGFGLCTAHASQTGRNEQAPTQVAILRNAQFEASGIKEGIERAVHNALRTDVHPPAGGHLPVVGHAHLHGGVPVFLIVVKPHHQSIGDDNTRCVGFRLEQAQRVSALNNQRLVARQQLQVLLDKTVLHPVLAHLPGLAIRHQFVRIKGDVETQVVVYHHLKSLPFYASALVFVYRTSLEVALWTVTVAVNAPAGTEFFHEFGSQLFV